MPRVWSAITGWLSKSSPRPDYGTGYYVRSTAHPVVPDTGMTHDQTVEALSSLDAVYADPEGE